jgi:hypothetical protein
MIERDYATETVPCPVCGGRNGTCYRQGAETAICRVNRVRAGVYILRPEAMGLPPLRLPIEWAE